MMSQNILLMMLIGYSLIFINQYSIQIVWDLPQISDGLQTLKKSRIAAVYNEVSPKLAAFGKILARSFEVQALIALVNCVLTTIGLAILQVSKRPQRYYTDLF